MRKQDVVFLLFSVLIIASGVCYGPVGALFTLSCYVVGVSVRFIWQTSKELRLRRPGVQSTPNADFYLAQLQNFCAQQSHKFHWVTIDRIDQKFRLVTHRPLLGEPEMSIYVDIPVGPSSNKVVTAHPPFQERFDFTGNHSRVQALIEE